MKVDPAISRSLMEIAFLATDTGLYDQSIAIFKAIEAATDTGKKEFPLIGQAFCLLAQCKFNDAIVILEKVEKLNPKNEIARAYKGYCLRGNGSVAQGTDLLKEIANKGSDPLAVNFAKEFLAVNK